MMPAETTTERMELLKRYKGTISIDDEDVIVRFQCIDKKEAGLLYYRLLNENKEEN